MTEATTRIETVAGFSRSRLTSGLAPVVSVIVPVYDQWNVTLRCLESLLQCDPEIAIQVIVADDASSDETPQMVARLPGIDLIRNGRNRGFLRTCNRAAALAGGRHVLLLNNDTEVKPGALRALVDRIESDDTIGIVGSKLVYPDGRLQEAGGIIWSDADGWNFGRFDAPERPEYAFARDVDYVSGASLLIRTDIFRGLGGFDDRFAPAYYEDADLCFAVRALGKRVVYEPQSVVIHYEGISSGTDLSSGTKRFQALNKPKFRAKWHDVLERDHLAPDAANVPYAARMRGKQRRSMLIIDSYVPLHDREAGSNRMRRLIDGFLRRDMRVIFYPDNGLAMEPYCSELLGEGVEVVYRASGEDRSWQTLLGRALETVDLVWLCRPELCLKYMPVIRPLSSVPVIYDTIDLHHVRMRRQAELENADDLAWMNMRELELACAGAADATVVVTESEAELLRDLGIETVAVVPTVHDLEPLGTEGFDASRGVLFIGGYNHTPNVDAVTWLVRSIMPRVWEELPDVRVTLLGANPPETVTALAESRVVVTGYIADVGPFFRSARVFVAPLRYGAGIKGKIGQALAFGVPVVTTTIGADGFGLTSNESALIADDEAGFAEAIIELYRNRERWNALARNGPAVLDAFSSARAVEDAERLIDRVLSDAGNSRNAPNIVSRTA